MTPFPDSYYCYYYYYLARVVLLYCFVFIIAAGMTVVGTAGTEQGMELVKSNGAHLVFNHR